MQQITKAGPYLVGGHHICLLVFLVAGLVITGGQPSNGAFWWPSFSRSADCRDTGNLIALPMTALWAMPAGVFTLMALLFVLNAPQLTRMVVGIDGTLFIAEAAVAWPRVLLRLGALGAGGLVVFTLVGYGYFYERARCVFSAYLWPQSACCRRRPCRCLIVLFLVTDGWRQHD